MARGRMLSKAISLDEKVNALSDDTARLLFTWMIAHLDVEGRMYGDARLFISIVAPRRNFALRKVEKYLMEFEKQGLIMRYNVNGDSYLVAPNFEKHQTGLQKNREAQSQIPPPPPELLQSYSRVSTVVTPELLHPKLSISKVKLKRREVEGKTTTPTVPSFISYKEKLQRDYLDFNIDDEWERCQIWHRDNNKTIKSPSNALGNWMRIAREMQPGTKDNKPKPEPDNQVKNDGWTTISNDNPRVALPVKYDGMDGYKEY